MSCVIFESDSSVIVKTAFDSLVSDQRIDGERESNKNLKKKKKCMVAVP